jgi:hypothetical protein
MNFNGSLLGQSSTLTRGDEEDTGQDPARSSQTRGFLIYLEN